MAALGVTVNVSALHRGLVTVDNTAIRKSDISAIENIISSGSLGKLEALRLRGRMQFASGQIFGRLAKKVLAVITNHAYGSSSSQISQDVISSLVLYKKLLGVDVPRELRVILLFTDASFEPEHPSWQAGLGAVLCSNDGQILHFFSVQADSALRDKLNVQEKNYHLRARVFHYLVCIA